MKKLLAAFAALIIGASPVFSEPELNVSVFSRHEWRGQTGSDAVSIQPQASIPVGKAGTNVSLWGQYPINGADTEIDITVSQIVGGIANVSATSYYYDGPFLEGDSHDIELGVATGYAGVGIFVGRFLTGDDVKDDTWVSLNYDLDGINVFAGAGDGGYIADGDGFGLVLIGASAANEGGYGVSLIYNVDTETPLLIASKAW